MTIQLGGAVTFQGSVSSPLFPCLTLPLRNLSFDCEFLTRKPIRWLHSQRYSATGCPQHPNIVLRRVTNTSCLAFVLNELGDRHALIFPIPVCNQPRILLDCLSFHSFWWGPSGNE